jgi:hypothetical protein
VIGRVAEGEKSRMGNLLHRDPQRKHRVPQEGCAKIPLLNAFLIIPPSKRARGM